MADYAGKLQRSLRAGPRRDRGPRRAAADRRADPAAVDHVVFGNVLQIER